MKLARLKLGLEKLDIPNWQFKGFYYPYWLVRASYRAYLDHGILLVAGGFLDQPPEWWRDIWTCDDLYNTKLEEERPKEQERPQWNDPLPMDELVRHARRSEMTDG